MPCGKYINGRNGPLDWYMPTVKEGMNLVMRLLRVMSREDLSNLWGWPEKVRGTGDDSCARHWVRWFFPIKVRVGCTGLLPQFPWPTLSAAVHYCILWSDLSKVVVLHLGKCWAQKPMNVIRYANRLKRGLTPRWLIVVEAGNDRGGGHQAEFPETLLDVAHAVSCIVPLHKKLEPEVFCVHCICYLLVGL